MKTEPYDQSDVAKVVQVRATVEGLKLGPGVLDRLAKEGARSSLRSFLLFTYTLTRLTLLIPGMRCNS